MCTTLMKILILIILMFLTTSCRTLQFTSNALIVIDSAQTLSNLQGTGEHETNVLLGKHPSREEVLGYFSSMILLNTSMGNILPEKYSDNWYMFIIGMQGHVVYRNHMISLNYQLP